MTIVVKINTPGTLHWYRSSDLAMLKVDDVIVWGDSLSIVKKVIEPPWPRNRLEYHKGGGVPIGEEVDVDLISSISGWHPLRLYEQGK